MCNNFSIQGSLPFCKQKETSYIRTLFGTQMGGGGCSLLCLVGTRSDKYHESTFCFDTSLGEWIGCVGDTAGWALHWLCGGLVG